MNNRPVVSKVEIDDKTKDKLKSIARSRSYAIARRADIQKTYWWYLYSL
jgi:hypothetical protein